MSSITKIDYFLPITRVHLTALVSTVTDTILRRSEPGITTSYAFSLVTVADPDRPRTLKVESGLLQDYSFDLKMTEDGRLTSTDVESTGRATLVLATGAAAVAAGAALVAGQLPLAAALAAGAVKAGEQALSLDEEDDQTAAPPGVDTEVWGAYKQAQPGPAQRTTRLLALCAATESDLDDARDQLREAAGNAERRHELRKQVATLRELLGDLKADLGDLQRTFTAWRAGTMLESPATYDELLPLDLLPLWEDGALTFPDGDQRAKEFWENTGKIMAAVGTPSAHTTPSGRLPAAEVCILRPRQAVLAHVGKTGGQPALSCVDRVLIMDHTCPELILPIRRSRSGKRQTAASLSDLGALTGISYGGTSPAAADASTLAALAAGLSTSLNGDKKSPGASKDS